MNVSEKSRIKTVLRRFPTAEEALGWYGIETAGFDHMTTVDEIAREYQMDVDDLIGDLQAHVADAQRESAPVQDDGDDDDDAFEEDDWAPTKLAEDDSDTEDGTHEVDASSWQADDGDGNDDGEFDGNFGG